MQRVLENLRDRMTVGDLQSLQLIREEHKDNPIIQDYTDFITKIDPRVAKLYNNLSGVEEWFDKLSWDIELDEVGLQNSILTDLKETVGNSGFKMEFPIPTENGFMLVRTTGVSLELINRSPLILLHHFTDISLLRHRMDSIICYGQEMPVALLYNYPRSALKKSLSNCFQYILKEES